MSFGFRQLLSTGNRIVCQSVSGATTINTTTYKAIKFQTCSPQLILNRKSSSLGDFKDDDLLLFFKDEVQTILKTLTGFNLEKVFSQRKLGDRLDPPQYKFMTSEQVKQAFEESEALAKDMLQMPPVVPIRKEINVVLSRDPELIGGQTSKYVFTDISFGKTDRTRSITVRDIDGTLRKARWAERRNANQTYFPRPGRQFRVPKMFQPDLLKNVLEREEFLFVLDRACIEFDADDPDYHRVTQATYKAVDEKQAYGTLRYTRHFGPFVFYLTLTKNIDNLLLDNLTTDRLDDAAQLIQLFHIVHPTSSSSALKYEPGQEVSFIKGYIEGDSKLKVALELALMKQNQEQTEAVL